MSKEIIAWQCDLCVKVYDTEERADQCCQPSRDVIRTKYCVGCYNEYYNQHEPNHCWHLPKARIIYRKEVHINDRPPWNHTPKKLPDCYRKSKHIYAAADQVR